MHKELNYISSRIQEVEREIERRDPDNVIESIVLSRAKEELDNLKSIRDYITTKELV